MSRHTPGPWHVDILNSEHEFPGPYYVSADGDDGGVAMMDGRLENRMGDARLIAAAPAMLAVLKELIRQVDLSNAVDDHGHELRRLQALSDARAAIAAAEGAQAPEGEKANGYR